MSFTIEYLERNGPFLDIYEAVNVNYKDILPHWEQKEKLQFITFRLADSLPQEKREYLIQLKNNFLIKHPTPWNKETVLKFRSIFSHHIEKLIDRGYGNCILKNKEVQNIVKETIFYYDEDKYLLYSFVIMPNHIHLLMRMLGDNEAEAAVNQIKKYTTRMINLLTGKKGKVWYRSFHDRIVRNEIHYCNCMAYIKDNPKNLKKGDYFYYYYGMKKE